MRKLYGKFGFTLPGLASLLMAYGPICHAEIKWSTGVQKKISAMQVGQPKLQPVAFGSVTSDFSFDAIGLNCGKAEKDLQGSELKAGTADGLRIVGNLINVKPTRTYGEPIPMKFELAERMSSGVANTSIRCAPVIRNSVTKQLVSADVLNVTATSSVIDVEYSGTPYAVVTVPQKTIAMRECAVGKDSRESFPVDIHYVGKFGGSVPMQRLTWKIEDNPSNPVSGKLSLEKDHRTMDGAIGFSQAAKQDKGDVKEFELVFECKKAGKYTWDVVLTTTLE